MPSDDECIDEHTERIDHLVQGGIDLLLIETMNSIREAVIAAKIAAATGIPVWVTFVCDKDGCILSGESLTHAAELLMPLGVGGVGVPCLPALSIALPLNELLAMCGEDVRL
ncbi:MAG: homocysteine S-methyltransferase family protein, partial [Pirellula sp.]